MTTSCLLTKGLPQIWIHRHHCLSPPRLASVVAHHELAVWPPPGAAPLLPHPHPAAHLQSLSNRCCLSRCLPDMCPQPTIEQVLWCCEGFTCMSRLRKLSCCMGAASASLSLSYSSLSSASKKALLSTPPGLAPLASNVTSGRLEPRRAFVCSMRLPCESLHVHAIAAQQGQLQVIKMQASRRNLTDASPASSLIGRWP